MYIPVDPSFVNLSPLNKCRFYAFRITHPYVAHVDKVLIVKLRRKVDSTEDNFKMRLKNILDHYSYSRDIPIKEKSSVKKMFLQYVFYVNNVI